MKQRSPTSVLRSAFSLALASASLTSVAATPLRSPWDGKQIVLSDVPFKCPTLPAIAPDLTTEGFYRLEDPTHSIIDPVRMEAYTRSSGQVKAVGLALVGEADAYRTTGSRAAAQCAFTQMVSLAKQRSLTGKMSSSQAYYVQGWVAGAIAIAYIKVVGSGLATSAEQAAITEWLVRIGDASKLWYDEHLARTRNALGNNHLYWAGVELAAIGVAANNRKDFDWGIAAYENGASQIRPDGTLPLEMARGSRALHYHLYALAPLVLLAEFGETNGLDLYSFHNGAIHRLVNVCVHGMTDPALFVSATGKEQEFSQQVTGDQIGWAPPYLRRFPNAALTRYADHAPNLSVFYLGGLPPP